MPSLQSQNVNFFYNATQHKQTQRTRQKKKLLQERHGTWKFQPNTVHAGAVFKGTINFPLEMPEITKEIKLKIESD